MATGGERQHDGIGPASTSQRREEEEVVLSIELAMVVCGKHTTWIRDKTSQEHAKQPNK
jgi:hypothetical protein